MIHAREVRPETPRMTTADLLLGIAEKPRPALAALVAALDRAVRRGEEHIAGEVAAILKDRVKEPDLLAGISYPALSQRYTRHSLHSADDYSVVAVVWRPGQMSSVHSHKTWCAFGVHRGSLTESLFRLEPYGPERIGWRQHRPGTVSHLPRAEAIHQIANFGTEIAISVHVYGAPFHRLADGVNQVWAN